MPKQIATLYIDDSSIKLMVASHDRVRTWGTIRLEPGLVEGLVVADPDRLAIQIRQLLAEHRVRTRQFTVGVSAIHSLTRQITLPDLPHNLLVEAVQREAGRLLPIPLEQIYLSWQTVPAPEGKINVFLAALRRSSIDSIFQTLKAAKIKAHSLTVKPLAIARLIKNPTALFIDAQSHEFDIVILSDGIPLPSRTVSFKSESLSPQEKCMVIADELARTLKFYSDNNPDRPLAPDLPLYISGDIVEQTKMNSILASTIPYQVQEMGYPLTFPDGFDPQGYMVNAGLSVVADTVDGPVVTDVLNLNIMPDEYRNKPVNWMRVTLLPSAATLIAVIVILLALIGASQGNLVSAKVQLASANKTLQDRQVQKQKLNAETKKLQDNLALMNSKLQECKFVMDTLANMAYNTNTDLNTVFDNLPGDMILESLVMNQNATVLKGVAKDNYTILSYSRILDSSGRFSEIVVTKILDEDTGWYSFTITLIK